MKFLLGLSLVLLCSFRHSLVEGQEKPCKMFKGACMCTAEYCDEFPSFPTTTKEQVAVFVSTKGGKRFSPETVDFKPICGPGITQSCYPEHVKERSAIIEINSDFTSHEIIGVGAAFSDAAILGLNRMKPDIQEKLLESYFDKRGIQYTIARVPIASTDFSTSSYSYCDKVDDFNLTSFSIEQDVGNKIKTINRGLKMSSDSGRSLALFASPWSPPPWMKENNNFAGGKLKGVPGGPYYKAWAKYFSKFFTEYEKHGIKFWGVTSQNEPNEKTRWESCQFTPEEMRDFIKLDLGPELARTHPDIKIIAHDDQKPSLRATVEALLGDPEAAKYVHGFGVHWYFAADGYLSWGFDKLKEIKEKYPQKFILATEACEGFLQGFFYLNPIKLGDWNRGQRYSTDIIGDLNNGASGWVDWNMFLDMKGGPNHAKNNVDAPILLDTVSGTKFYKQPMYYHLGHFSKFLLPGSKIIPNKIEYKGFLSKEVDMHVTVAKVVKSDQSVKTVVIVMNPHMFKKTIFIKDLKNSRMLRFVVDKNSIQTFEF